MENRRFWCNVLSMLDDDESFVRAKTVTLLGHVYVSECLWKIFCEENRYSKVKLKFGQLTSVKFGQRDVADILNVFFQIYEQEFYSSPKDLNCSRKFHQSIRSSPRRYSLRKLFLEIPEYLLKNTRAGVTC